MFNKKITFGGCIVTILTIIGLVFFVSFIRVITRNAVTEYFQKKKTNQTFPLISKDAKRTILGDTMFFEDKGVKYKIVKMGDSLYAYDAKGRLFCKDSKANILNCTQNLNGIQNSSESYLKGDTVMFVENGVTFKVVVKKDSAYLYDSNNKFIRKFSLKASKQ